MVDITTKPPMPIGFDELPRLSKEKVPASVQQQHHRMTVCSMMVSALPASQLL